MKKKARKVIDGKVDKPEQKDLYDIIGQKRKTPYSSSQTLEEYKKEIEGMQTSDLHEHAISVGLIPIHNRRVLISRLEREFARSHLKMSSSSVEPALKGERAKRFMDIMQGKK